MQHIFLNNYQLCSEVSEPVLQHFVHLLATHGRHVQYLDFLHTVIKAEGKYVKKCQDMIMTEVSGDGLAGLGVAVESGSVAGHSHGWARKELWVLGAEAGGARATQTTGLNAALTFLIFDLQVLTHP